MRRFLLWFASRFRHVIIYDRAGGSPYLTRYYLLGGPRTGPEGEVWSKLPFTFFLHRFHRGDDDVQLHNHPWRWSASFILAGGYSEERRRHRRFPCGWSKTDGISFGQHIRSGGGYEVTRRTVKPFRFNVIRAGDFHRVDLLESDCWTLFIAGPKAQSWGFWDRFTNLFTPWREFIARRRGISVESVGRSK